MVEVDCLSSSATPVSEMLDIFKECQENSLCHERLCIKLKNLYSKSRFTHFADEFFELCRYSLVSMERSAYRERTIDFITKFALLCGQSEDGQPQDILGNRLLLKFFLFCLKYNECPNPAVRFRCMQIVHKLLEGIGDNGVLPDELYGSLQTVLLRRVQDIKASVRVRAVQALSRMQDPTDADCPAVEAFIWLARHDPTSEVRRAALAAMVLTTRTLPELVDRCRDISDVVRRTAYKILAGRSVLRPLSIAKRIRLLQDGLTDRSDEVRQTAEQMLLSWFNVTNKDPIQLLRRLDTEGVPETSQLALDHLFHALSRKEFALMVTNWAAVSLTDERILKPDCFTAEASFFWRSVVEYLLKWQSNEGRRCEATLKKETLAIENGSHEVSDGEEDEMLSSADILLPSVTSYVELAKSLVDKFVQSTIVEEFDERALELECVLQHVLRLATSLDLSDEFGRRKLADVVREWITSPRVPSTLSPQLVKLHTLLEHNLRKRVNDLVEMVSELCDYSEPIIVEDSSTRDKRDIESATVDCVAPVTEPGARPTELSKEAERVIRLQIARLEVHLNELNESLHNCVQKKAFEKATELRDTCSRLEVERNNLLHKLHGSLLPAVQLTSNESCNPPSVLPTVSNSQESQHHEEQDIQLKQEEQANDDSGEEDEKEKDEPQQLLQRCPPAILIKANRIAALVIQQSHNLWRLPASLRSLLDSLILPSIQHLDTSVRNQAMLTLGLCCSIDLPLALQYLPLFYSALRVDHTLICETALRSIIDCLLLFGFRPFHEASIRLNKDSVVVGTDNDEDDEAEEADSLETDASDYVVLMRRNVDDPTFSGPCPGVTTREDMSKTAARLLKPIVSLLDSEDDDLRTASALGLAKLLIYDRFVSPTVLSRLLLLWFSPLSGDSPAIRRGLGCFFSDYACSASRLTNGSTAMSTSLHDCHQAALADAVLPTLTALIRAPASSPLSEIEAVDVAGLLARLTDATQLPATAQSACDTAADINAEILDDTGKAKVTEPVGSQANPQHDRLSLMLISEVLKAPQSAEAKLYLRLLCQLHPSPHNVAVHRKMLLMCESMLKFVDRSSGLLLHRFRKQVSDSLTRLGLDPEKILADSKPNVNKTKSDGPRSRSAVGNTSDSDDDDDTFGPDVTRLSVVSLTNLHHPTLLGSARPNVHLLATGGAIGEHDDGNKTLNHQPINRTQPGLSILDKSGFHGAMPNFSDDEDDDDDSATPNGTVEPSSVSATREHSKKRVRIRKVTKSLGTDENRIVVRHVAESSTQDEDVVEGEKENFRRPAVRVADTPGKETTAPTPTRELRSGNRLAAKKYTPR